MDQHSDRDGGEHRIHLQIYVCDDVDEELHQLVRSGELWQLVLKEYQEGGEIHVLFLHVALHEAHAHGGPIHYDLDHEQDDHGRGDQECVVRVHDGLANCGPNHDQSVHDHEDHLLRNHASHHTVHGQGQLRLHEQLHYILQKIGL